VTALVRSVNADKRTVNVTTDPQHVNSALVCRLGASIPKSLKVS
jgi:hypothetical protein